METSTTIGILKSTIGNPISRAILKSLSKYCEKDKKNRIEVAIELFTGKREDACIGCRAAEKILRKFLIKAGEVFGVGEEELRERFKDAYWAKALASTLKGIAYFGVRRPFTAGAPYQIVWDVTYACNLRCKHCYANAGKPLKNELTTEQAKKAIDIFDRAGVTILAFSGGEPLVRPDIFELARYAADKGMYVAMATNGTLITSDVARKMKKAGIQFVQISLDGATAETHDEFRGIPGAFDRTIRGIKNAVKEGFFVEIATTATKSNYKEIPAIIDLAEELRVNWLMLYNFVPTGRGRDIVERDLSPKEREELLKMIYHKNKETNVEILSTAPQLARVALQEEYKEKTGEVLMPTHFYNAHLPGKLANLAEFIGGCGAGRFYMSMRPNGDLQPCVFLPIKVGNILEDNFEDLWLHNRILNELRDKDLIKECNKCPYRYHCGGCRARAYGYFGDYLAPDPGCIINRHVYEEAVTVWK